MAALRGGPRATRRVEGTRKAGPKQSCRAPTSNAQWDRAGGALGVRSRSLSKENLIRSVDHGASGHKNMLYGALSNHSSAKWVPDSATGALRSPKRHSACVKITLLWWVLFESERVACNRVASTRARTGLDRGWESATSSLEDVKDANAGGKKARYWCHSKERPELSVMEK